MLKWLDRAIDIVIRNDPQLRFDSWQIT